jgi:hypothetical protein
LAGQIAVLPFRDAFARGCFIPYLSVGGAGSGALGSFQGPSAGGGLKYYFAGGVGLGLDGRAIFPQVTEFGGGAGVPRRTTIYMLTVRLLLQPVK